MQRHVLLAAALIVSSVRHTSAGAQQPAAGSQPAQPRTIVVSQNKCRLDAVARVDSLAAIAFYPVLDELVKEGQLMGWGALTHDWGDEWNFVIYYTAANTAAFHTAWAELIRRVTQRRATFLADLAAHCTEHKDNIYSVMRIGASPPTQR